MLAALSGYGGERSEIPSPACISWPPRALVLGRPARGRAGSPPCRRRRMRDCTAAAVRHGAAGRRLLWKAVPEPVPSTGRFVGACRLSARSVSRRGPFSLGARRRGLVAAALWRRPALDASKAPTLTRCLGRQVWIMAGIYVAEFLIHALRSPDLDVINGLKCPTLPRRSRPLPSLALSFLCTHP